MTLLEDCDQPWLHRLPSEQLLRERARGRDRNLPRLIRESFDELSIVTASA